MSPSRAARRLAAAALAAALAWPAANAAQQPGAGPPPAAFDSVAASIRAAIRDGAFPSAAVAVAKDGRIVWEAGFGWADRERRIPAEPTTPYSLASISKPMTATGIMLLVEEGRVELDAPVNQYLRGTALTGLAGDAAGATVERVLGHTAGLPLHYEFFYAGEDHAPRPMTTAIERYGILVSPPGEVLEYSNLGYGILDEVIARVSGTGYADFMRDRVFRPLGLERTAVDLPPSLARDAAVRYFSDGLPVPWYDFDHAGGSAVWASARDLARFGMFHLGQDAPGRRAILSEATRRRMQRPLAPAGAPFDYGLGWIIDDVHGARRVSHSGGMPGVSTMLDLYPDEGVAVVVLTNQINGRVQTIAEDLAAAVMPAYARRLREDRAGAAERRTDAGDVARFEPPARLLGAWRGSLRTYEGEAPFTLVVQPDGDVHARIGDQPAGLLNGTRWDDGAGRLTGRFVGTVPTEDARRHPHAVVLDVRLRDGALAGQATAQSIAFEPHYFSLSSYVRLEKE